MNLKRAYYGTYRAIDVSPDFWGFRDGPQLHGLLAWNRCSPRPPGEGARLLLGAPCARSCRAMLEAVAMVLWWPGPSLLP